MDKPKILFHSNQLGERGTEVAMYRLARECKIQGHLIAIAANKSKTLVALPNFKELNCPIILYNDFEEVQQFISDNKFDWLYATKGGKNDGIIARPPCKTFVHTVFQRTEPHGDKYVFISKWLAESQGYKNNLDYLPYIVWDDYPGSLVDIDIRKVLNMPNDAKIIIRVGGYEEFNLPGINEFIQHYIDTREDVYFVLVNTKPLPFKHPRIIYVEKTIDRYIINRLLYDADVFLHARVNGESFGLAIAESLAIGTPVLAYNGGLDKNHIEMLKMYKLYRSNSDENVEYCGLYDNYLQLEYKLDDILNNQSHVFSFDKVAEYLPFAVYEKFMRILNA